ncbi:MAG TPA: SRPBCC domain-containing protein [Acidimicrobiia bacterium]|nr:SRPBCC domain-containing protein [Acidimicrobiia bacterium]
MTVIDVRKDPTELSMTVASEWDAPVARVWQLWADPRKLERWWGPPTFPATVVEHDLRPGGKVSYYMTGPEGDRHHGWWRVVAVDEPHRLDLEDGFADTDGNPDDTLPTTRFTVTFVELPSGRTRMLIENRFPSREAMDQLIEMGMDEGLAEAMGQIDAILADS